VNSLSGDNITTKGQTRNQVLPKTAKRTSKVEVKGRIVGGRFRCRPTPPRRRRCGRKLSRRERGNAKKESGKYVVASPQTNPHESLREERRTKRRLAMNRVVSGMDLAYIV
jgi:hypothetical protein